MGYSNKYWVTSYGEDVHQILELEKKSNEQGSINDEACDLLDHVFWAECAMTYHIAQIGVTDLLASSTVIWQQHLHRAQRRVQILRDFPSAPKNIFSSVFLKPASQL